MKKLFGYDWRISIQFGLTVFVQLFMAYMVRNSSWTELLILTYVVSGTLNHSLSVGLHEISHNLAFGPHRPLANRLFASSFGKIIYVGLLPLLYTLRPVIMMPKQIDQNEVINAVLQISFDTIIYLTLGFNSLFYLMVGTLLGLGFHPISGHFIAEHYVFVKGYETYSYYGPLNLITFNVGYHNEHHDFPNIPCYRLPEVYYIIIIYFF